MPFNENGINYFYIDDKKIAANDQQNLPYALQLTRNIQDRQPKTEFNCLKGEFARRFFGDFLLKLIAQLLISLSRLELRLPTQWDDWLEIKKTSVEPEQGQHN